MGLRKELTTHKSRVYSQNKTLSNRNLRDIIMSEASRKIEKGENDE